MKYITIVIFCITGFVFIILEGVVFTQDTQKPFVPSSWAEAKSKFTSIYSDKSPDKRMQAIEYMDKIFDRIILSDTKYGIEAVEFLSKVLSIEEDEKVRISVKNTLSKFLINASFLEWMSLNHKNIFTTESAKLRFIDVLAISTNSYEEKFMLAIINDLLAKNELSAARIKVIELLLPKFLSKSVYTLLGLIKDTDVNVCKTAIKSLALVINIWDKVGELIKLLGEEQRNAIKGKIGWLLEEITDQSFKTDVTAWQKWWASKPNHTGFQQRVDVAIDKGVDYLLKNTGKGDGLDALVLYTLLKSSSKKFDTVIAKFRDGLLDKELIGRGAPDKNTYYVGVRAMAVAELDKIEHFERIVQCAEYLLANQSVKGWWGYAIPSITSFINTDLPKPVTPTGGTSTKSIRKFRIKVPPRNVTNFSYDISISQFAVLGLRACADSNIEFPSAVWRDAEKAFISTQNKDGGWCCCGGGRSVHTMTAGGLSCLAICLFYQDKDIKNDPNIKKAMNWLDKNFTIADPSGDFTECCSPYYYLYALERCGTLIGTESFGKNEWYPLGTGYLLREQKQDGSWGNNSWGSAAIDTCFAILFLRRATKPFKIVITGEEKK